MVPLVLASALLHALWNASLRRSKDPQAATVGLIFIAALAALIAAPFLVDRDTVWITIGFGLQCGVSEGAYFATNARSMAHGPLGPIYAVSRGGGLLLLWPLSHVLFAEPITAWELGAVAALLIGLVLLAPAGKDKPTSNAGYLWAIAAAGCVATNHVLYKAAVDRGAMPVPLFAFSMLLATPIAALAAGANRSRSIIDAMASKTIWLGGLCCAASFVAALYAMRSSGVAWVLTLRNSSIGFAQLLGWLLLRERPSRRGIAGVALVLAGAFAVGIR